MSPDRRVIAIDLLGRGKTDKPDTCTYIADVMRDPVRASLNVLSVQTFDLDGRSVASRIAPDVVIRTTSEDRRIGSGCILSETRDAPRISHFRPP
ncbi:alpha/beta fold hydrolase [Loktanella sp. M215]|uniref:alpha/beta fold hydrolase n=1 Tax=Loktanella sp. M215 TaxID=2675431 RepID=UPI001F23CE54|nr:alpha/beta hydrolase [Loktanella sp. M215]MCF7701109.1 hypothetical protein [Loktanella sp. M215]